MNYLQIKFIIVCVCFVTSVKGARAKRCEAPGGLNGMCIPLERCESISKFVTERKPMTDAEKSALNLFDCGSVKRHSKVCCPHGEFNIDWVYANCITPDGESGKCKPVNSCTPIIDFIKKVQNISKQQMTELRKYICSNSIAGTYFVCCPSVPLIPLPLSDRSVEQPKDHSKHRNINLLPKVCGEDTGVSKIRNGKVVEIHEFPWAVALLRRTGTGLKYYCGASLISNQYILTAAHCMVFDKIVVRLGEHDLRTEKDCNDEEYCAPPHQDFEVSSSDITVHPQYNKKSLQNDIALIKLRNKVTITDMLNPVCLPITIEEKNNRAKIYTVIGWGSPGTAVKSNVLMKTIIPTRQIRKNPFRGEFNVGGVNETDPCGGDSGGPLMADYVHNRAFKIIQYGIVSMGPEPCAKENVPTRYTKVEAYLDWILDNLTS